MGEGDDSGDGVGERVTGEVEGLWVDSGEAVVPWVVRGPPPARPGAPPPRAGGRGPHGVPGQ